MRDNASGLPVHYRRILVLLESPTHSNVVRTALRCYTDQQLLGWLAELDTFGFIQATRVTSRSQEDLDFTDRLFRADISTRLRVA